MWIHIESDTDVIRERLSQGVCDTFEKEQLEESQEYLEKYRAATKTLDGHTVYNNSTIEDCAEAIVKIIKESL